MPHPGWQGMMWRAMVLSGKLHVYKWTWHTFRIVLVLFLSCRRPCHVHIQHILQSRRFRMTCIGGTHTRTNGVFSSITTFCCSISIFKEPNRYAFTPWLNPSWAEGTALELWSEVGSWCSHEMRWAKMAGRCGSRVFIRVKGMDLFPGDQTFAGKNGSGLTNWSKGWVAYPQIAWLGNLSMLKIQNGWEFRFVSRWGSKSSIWNGVIPW